MWSIGNEIYDTHVDENGQYWCRVLMDEVRKYDRKENAQITLASNYLPWENARKCADIVKNVGYNYGENIMMLIIKNIRTGLFMEARLALLSKAEEFIISISAVCSD